MTDAAHIDLYGTATDDLCSEPARRAAAVILLSGSGIAGLYAETNLSDFTAIGVLLLAGSEYTGRESYQLCGQETGSMKQLTLSDDLDADKLAEVALGLLTLTIHDGSALGKVWTGPS